MLPLWHRLRCRHMGAYLREARLRHNMSLADVAYRTGIKIYRLQSVERGDDSLGAHHWDAICRAIPGVDPLVLESFARAYNRPTRFWRLQRLWRRHGEYALLGTCLYGCGVLLGTCLALPYRPLALGAALVAHGIAAAMLAIDDL